MKPQYYYRGRLIRVGDTVRTGNDRIASIVELIPPEGTSDVTGQHCPTGGILVEEDWNGRSSLLLFAPYDAEWEDMEFVERDAPS